MDFLLLAVAIVLAAFGVYIGIFKTATNNKEVIIDWAAAIILVTTGVLLGNSAVPTEQFNPALDDCTIWELEDNKCVSWQPKKQRSLLVPSPSCSEYPSDTEKCRCVKTGQNIIAYNPALTVWIFQNRGRGNAFVIENFTNASLSHRLYDVSYGFEADGRLLSTKDKAIADYLLKRNESLTIIASEDTQSPIMAEVCVEAVPR